MSRLPIILAVDTTATPVSCAVVRDGRVLSSYFSHTGLTHSQTLLPMVEHVLRLTELTPEDLDAIAVDVGPGSFTGVRIGVAAVKGLAFAHEIPCVAVSTTQAMAQPFAGLPSDATVCCVMDARRRQVYTARYALDTDGTLTRLTPDEAIAVDELTAALRAEREECGKTEKNKKKSVILVGDGAEMCYNTMKDELPDVMLAPPALRMQSAVGTALCAERLFAEGRTVTPEQLLPVYLRLPQAERELRSRLAAEQAASSDRPSSGQ